MLPTPTEEYMSSTTDIGAEPTGENREQQEQPMENQSEEVAQDSTLGMPEEQGIFNNAYSMRYGRSGITQGGDGRGTPLRGWENAHDMSFTDTTVTIAGEIVDDTTHSLNPPGTTTSTPMQHFSRAHYIDFEGVEMDFIGGRRVRRQPTSVPQNMANSGPQSAMLNQTFPGVHYGFPHPGSAHLNSMPFGNYSQGVTDYPVMSSQTQVTYRQTEHFSSPLAPTHLYDRQNQALPSMRDHTYPTESYVHYSEQRMMGYSQASQYPLPQEQADSRNIGTYTSMVPQNTDYTMREDNPENTFSQRSYARRF
ncbi:hypothetical protein K435DRAFT_441150 [Dendrothele bispora CBS 962.96]|uniref:Uncharacterized protein n=1 Tax=Dendrothele bispora (strain CBS 962.96) TaxID=1314807 RepID=A0A4S8L3C3_DENBC|nr:hypothetical protein K435DRAFT_441150 [Dendrothele bispora CBS 962.96]